MSRPLKQRRLGRKLPRCVFRPSGKPLRTVSRVVLRCDEVEAIRLADLRGFYQEDAARRMQVSRQTFGRIVGSARRKIADAIINGKCLCREGWDGIGGTDGASE